MSSLKLSAERMDGQIREQKSFSFGGYSIKAKVSTMTQNSALAQAFSHIVAFDKQIPTLGTLSLRKVERRLR
jgi:hypothetical protein